MTWLPLVAFGALVFAALGAVWRDQCLRLVGASLVFSYVVSNMAFFYAPLAHRAGIFTMTEIVVVACAFLAWMDCRNRGLTILVVIAVASICANVGFAATGGQIRALYTYELLTNLLFTLECLVVIGMGVAERGSIHRLGRWLGSGRDGAERDAAR